MPTISETLDAPSSTATTYEISHGDEFLGEISSGADSDWVRIDLDVGYGYYISLGGDGSANSLGRTRLILRDDAGQQILTASGGSTGIGFTPTSSGTFYIDTQGQFSNDTGGYVLELIQEVAASTGTVADIAAGTTLDSTLEYSRDVDMVRTQLIAGESYQITLEGDGSANSMSRAFLTIFDQNGNLVANPSTFTGGLTFTFTATQTGTYFLGVGQNSGSGVAGNYSLSILGDTQNGNALPNSLVGGASSDLIRGLEGNDTISGQGSNDQLFGGPGNDVIFGGTGNDTGQGGLGNDTVAGGPGADILTGGGGNDLLGGGAGQDALLGGGGDDTLQSGGGNDSGAGGTGNDVVSGGLGADFLSGDGGDDQVWGGDGHDLVSGGIGNDTIGTGAGNDTAFGGTGTDVLSGSGGNDVLNGDAGDDTIFGGAGHDTLTGGAGNDLLGGSIGHDDLSGGGGDDSLFGGSGYDTLTGGGGNDLLSGGSGPDSFVFSGLFGDDQIAGFSAADGDELRIDDGLWTGTLGALSDAEVIAQFSSFDGGGNVVLTFPNGSSITLDGVTSTNGLAATLDVF